MSIITLKTAFSDMYVKPSSTRVTEDTPLRISTEAMATMPMEKLREYMKSALNLESDQFTENNVLACLNSKQSAFLRSIPAFCNVLGESDSDRDRRIASEVIACSKSVIVLYAFLDIICSIMHPEDIYRLGLNSTMNIITVSLKSILRCMESLNLQTLDGYRTIKVLSECNVRDKLFHAINEERFLTGSMFTDPKRLKVLKSIGTLKPYYKCVVPPHKMGHLNTVRVSLSKMLNVRSHYTIDFIYKETPVLQRLRSQMKKVVEISDNLVCKDYVNEIEKVFTAKADLSFEVCNNFYLDSIQPELDVMVHKHFQGSGTINVIVNFVFEEEGFRKLRENGVSLFTRKQDYKEFLSKFLIFRLLSDFPDDIMFSIFRNAFTSDNIFPYCKYSAGSTFTMA